MEFLVGSMSAIVVGTSATLCGLDRDRAFYPTITMFIASYYLLFAAMGGSVQAIVAESAILFLFLAASILGFKSTLWLVVAALVAHGIFDLAHAHLIANAGVPSWWPSACFTYDIVAAGYLALLLRRALVPARSAPDR